MQTTRKAVRYYIDREADTPIIRTVPVGRPKAVEGDATARESGRTASIDAEPERERRAARRRLASLVQAGVRKNRRRAS